MPPSTVPQLIQLFETAGRKAKPPENPAISRKASYVDMEDESPPSSAEDLDDIDHELEPDALGEGVYEEASCTRKTDEENLEEDKPTIALSQEDLTEEQVYLAEILQEDDDDILQRLQDRRDAHLYLPKPLS